MDDNNDQMMHSTDTELLSSEEEFEYSTNQQSTISFSAISNLFLNSCYYYYDLFMQQLITQSLSNQLTLQHLTAIPLLQLAEIEQLINSQLIRSEYSQLITSSQFIRELLNSTLWDQWLCILAKLLTPNQWQLYWMNYLMQFGTVGLPQHLINFLQLPLQLQI